MIPLEKITDGSAAARNFDKIAQWVLDTGGQTASVRFGVASVVTTAAVSGSKSVTHGLGTTPVIAVATAVSTDGLINASVHTLGATTFTVVKRYTDDVARTLTSDVYWIAIG